MIAQFRPILIIETFTDVNHKVSSDCAYGDLFGFKDMFGRITEHRMLVGDSSNVFDVNRAIGGRLVDMVITDPPYNIGKKNQVAKNIRQSYKDMSEASWNQTFNLLPNFETTESYLSKDCTVYVTISDRLFGDVLKWALTWADTVNHLVWCKSNPMPSLQKRHYTWGTELIVYAARGKHTFNFIPSNGKEVGNCFNYWTEIPKIQKNEFHPTTKPSALFEKMMIHSSKEGDLIYDSFSGSGTVIIAAHKTNRVGVGIEIDPEYASMALKRIKKEVGLTAFKE